MEPGNYTSTEMTEEVRRMVEGAAFQDEKPEFSPLTDAFAAKAGSTGDEAWNLLAGKIVEVLPDCITSGLIHCSLSAIREQEVCNRAVREKQRELLIRPGDGFPMISFGTFSPYLEFFLRAGPVDLLRMKIRFRVEGRMALRDAKIRFSGDQITGISGTIMASVKISLCTGTRVVPVHQFEKTMLIG